jgi:drug/metabolite transporter (DMT)-like permease
MAWFVFHENFDRRIAIGMLCIVVGAATLAWSGTPSLQSLLGPLAVCGACAAWALDNNLTRKVALSNPLQIVELKGAIAGPVNLALGLWVGGALPNVSETLIAGLVGFLGYGVSLALFVVALRDLGTARTGAYFSTAPFLGAIAAVAFLNEPITMQLLLAGILMGTGVWLHVTEHHEHEHMHSPLVHEHPHVHDEHHQHQHSTGDPTGEPHTHLHKHVRMKHSHPHMPDMHHEHRH